MSTQGICLSFVLFLTGAWISHAQSANTLISARGLGLANATATLADEWSLLNNTGGLSKLKTTSAAVAYEAKPNLLGANRMAAVVALPTKIGTAGLGVFRFGDNLYSEQILSAGFGNTFGNTSIGLKVNYIQYTITGFGTKTAISLNFGGITQLTPAIAIGAYIVNLNRPTLSTIDGEKLPTRLVAGVSFKASEVVSLFTEIDKDIDYRPTIKGAVEYKLHKKVVARTGVNLQPEAAFFGLGFVSSPLKIDYAMQYNQNLNAAFQVSVIYTFIKQPKPKQ